MFVQGKLIRSWNTHVSCVDWSNYSTMKAGCDADGTEAADVSDGLAWKDFFGEFLSSVYV